MTVRTMSSEQARTEWRTLLDLASQGGVDVVIEQHGKAAAAVLEALAQLPERTSIAAPVAWHIEQRGDRALPGRDC